MAFRHGFNFVRSCGAVMSPTRFLNSDRDMPLYFVIMLQFATSHVISSSVVFESTLSIYPYRDWADIRYFFINSEIVFPDHRTSPAVSLSIMKTSTTATVTPPFSLLRLSQMPFHNCNKLRTGNRRTLFYEIVAISLNY